MAPFSGLHDARHRPPLATRDLPIIDLVLRLAVALFAAQAGFHAFTASLPVALARAGFGDAEIGVIVGTAAIVQMPAALAAGVAIDRFGGFRLFFAGMVAYLFGDLILLAVGVEPGSPILPLLAARTFQGTGIALVIPSVLSLVPQLVAPMRQGFGLSVVGSAQNLTQAVLPPVSLAILAASSIRGIALFVLVALGFATALAVGLRGRFTTGHVSVRGGGSVPSRSIRPVYRSSWTAPLVMSVLFVVHWGVVVAYLPQRAEAAGADIGLFFAADALAIFASRVPTGWLADRTPTRWLFAAGVAITVAAVSLLLLPPTTPLLVLAGIGTGVGGGLVVSPLLLEFARRSGPADRGSAFALFSVAFAAGLSLGSIGATPLVAAGGFEPALLVGIGGLVAAGAVALSDRPLGPRGRAPHEALAGPAVDSPGMVEIPPG